MSNKGNTKKITVKTEDGKVYKIFDSAQECAEYFGVERQIIYNRVGNPYHFYRAGNIRLSFQSETKTKNQKGEYINREKETEDQIRRRLGLSPYGVWRNDEWFFAMIERVNKRLYPDGYDHHAEWLRQRVYKQAKKKTENRDEEDDKLDLEL